MGRVLRAFHAFWHVDPFRAALIVFMLGLLPFIAATQFSTLGDIAYLMPTDGNTVCGPGGPTQVKCIVKQVGYVYAINWWPALMLLFPFTVFFSLVSIQSARSVFERLAASRMLVRPDWSSPVEDVGPILDRLWRNFLFLGVPLFLIVAAVMVRDWWCVVHLPLELEVALGGVQHSITRMELVPQLILEQFRSSGCSLTGQENDWSIAASFGNVAGLAALAPDTVKPSLAFNYVFSAYNYALLSLLSGLLFAYFGFVLALTITIYELNQGRFGVQLVLDLNSSDPRKRFGFEYLEPIFAPCVFITVIAFVMGFLMRIQNVYLRDVEFGNVFDFVFLDISSALGRIPDFSIPDLTDWLFNLIAKLKKYFAFDQFSDPQSLLGTPAILIMLSIVSATLGYVLRSTADESQKRVLAALNASAEQGRRVSSYFGLSIEEVRSRAASLQPWPLSWPDLRFAVRMLLVGVICYVFYRVAFVWIGIVAAQAIHGRWFGRR